MLVTDKIFEIPKSKSNEFIKQFESTKISDSFLEECRKSAKKTKIIKRRCIKKDK